ncbi:reverse transcriptase family protein [Flavobacterium rakeshii]|uniref:reverse transcriptase family protein n=1 Tax=Flavobacterium rakeshii TaxID=1038845 RepID=UPI002E7C168F|nr:reverse transcriptase family protein [Flavobacterium rakeshii]MEE1897281.1 reverse transcriptase family protein [Flavobacterium rakeshii]
MNSLESRQKLHFPSIIGFSNKELKKIISNIDKYYREWTEQKKDKNTGLPKTYKNGKVKERTIRPSKSKLKIIQSRINNRILNEIELPNNIHGGRKKHSNITNAKPHQGKKYILTTDLKDFYPSVKYSSVYQTFLELGFNKQTAYYITRLTTFKGELPQGTPTSTHISNIVFLKIDLLLIDFCSNNGITYTRYIDDLSFSSQSNFQDHVETLLEIVKNSGFKISWRKTFYNGSQTITGIKIFLNKIDAPEKILKKVAEEKLLLANTPKPYTSYRNNIIKTNKKNTPNPGQ